MTGKAKGVPRDVAIGLRLPRALHERLKAEAAGGSVNALICEKLEASFTAGSAGAADENTRQLLDAIVEMASRVNAKGGPAWHEDPNLFRTFKQALLIVLSAFQPDETGGPHQPESVAMAFAAVLAGSGISRLMNDLGAQVFFQLRNQKSAEALADFFKIDTKELPAAGETKVLPARWNDAEDER